MALRGEIVNDLQRKDASLRIEYLRGKIDQTKTFLNFLDKIDIWIGSEPANFFWVQKGNFESEIEEIKELIKKYEAKKWQTKLLDI